MTIFCTIQLIEISCCSFNGRIVPDFSWNSVSNEWQCLLHEILLVQCTVQVHHSVGFECKSKNKHLRVFLFKHVPSYAEKLLSFQIVWQFFGIFWILFFSSLSYLIALAIEWLSLIEWRFANSFRFGFGFTFAFVLISIWILILTLILFIQNKIVIIHNRESPTQFDRYMYVLC